MIEWLEQSTINVSLSECVYDKNLYKYIDSILMISFMKKKTKSIHLFSQFDHKKPFLLC